MKSYRFDFSKGINVVGDKATLGEGWVSVANNVDLRSGLPSPFRAPAYERAGTASSIQVFEFRGKFYFSAEARDYAAEYVDGADRIYYLEKGQEARKIINSEDVPLGLNPPQQPPLVALTSALVPVVTATASVASAGTTFKKDAERSYRVGATTAGGTQPACGKVVAVFTLDGQSVVLTWSVVPGAIGYTVYASDTQDTERKVAYLSSAILSWTDLGTVPASGEYASAYDLDGTYRYIYTFERTVEGMTDESGPSTLSGSVTAAQNRTITFDSTSDGLLDQEGVTYIDKVTNPVTVTESFTTYPMQTVSTAVPNAYLNQVVFTTVAYHGLVEGERIRFLGFADPLYNNMDFNVYAVTDDTFVVKDMPEPIGTLGNLIAHRTKFTLTTAPTEVVQDGYAVYVSLSGTSNTFVAGVYKATRIDDKNFTLSAYTSGSPTVTTGTKLTYTPDNGFIVYRNLYRVGDSGVYNLVKQVSIFDNSVVDDIVTTNLGDPITSYYSENGITVVYSPPPLGLSGITSHYGMLFAISRNRVRWTPIGKPDAWPDDFYYEFPHKPVALASYAQALIVLCRDGIYRIDGNEATRLSLSNTNAVNGCVAQHSVAKTHAGLLYLSERGIMSFNGTDSVCLTDSRIPGRMFQTPSYDTHTPYAWVPTVGSAIYLNLASEDGIYSVVGGYQNINTNIASGVMDDIKSFYLNGKYYLYYSSNTGYFPANTCFCIDLQAPGMPITTMGFKPIYVHVSDMEVAYALIGSADNWNPFYTAEVTLSSTYSYADSGTGRSVVRLESSNDYIPMTIRTGEMSLNYPLERKRFRQVELHGNGSGNARCRVFIDKRYVCDGNASFSEGSSNSRKINIPISRCMGYTLDVEMACTGKIRGMEIGYDVVGES